MPRGGARPGAGRKPKLKQPLKAYIAVDGLPLDYMLAVLRDPEADPHRRDRMAALAAPYLHRRMSPHPVVEDKPGLPLAMPTLGKKEAELASALRPDATTTIGALIAKRNAMN